MENEVCRYFIFLKMTANKKVIALQVQPKHTVAEMKAKIHEIQNVPPNDQRLIYMGKLLEDSKTVGEYNIERGSVLPLVLFKHDSIQIYVKTVTSKTINVVASIYDTIVQVKSKIRRIERIRKSEQCLLLDGKKLLDHKMLTFYNIQDQSTLYLVFRLRGGMQSVVDRCTSITLDEGVVEPSNTTKKYKE